MDASVVSAVTAPGFAAKTTRAAKAAPIAARLEGEPSSLMKDQTPVPLSSLPVATVITESMAVLMDQKMTIFGADSTRGQTVAEGATGAAMRLVGTTKASEDANSARSTRRRRAMFNWTRRYCGANRVTRFV